MSKTIQWAQDGNGFAPCGATVSKLQPGCYQPSTTGGMFPQLVVNAITPVTDNLLVLEDSPVESVTKGIQKFWQAADRYKKYGIIHKRGVLLEGPPGTGKTSIANLIAEFFVKKGGVVFFTGARSNLYETKEALQKFRAIQAEPLLIVIEEFDLIRDVEDVDMVMQMMDGVDQINNVVFLCTTNFLERIDPRFVQRPSRIDEIIHVGTPSAVARRSYLSNLLRFFGGIDDAATLEEFVLKTDGLLLAHVKEAVIAVRVLEQPLDATVVRLRGMMARESQEPLLRSRVVLSPNRAMANYGMLSSYDAGGGGWETGPDKNPKING